MSIRTFRIVEPYDTFYEKVCSNFSKQETVEVTAVEQLDEFSAHRSGAAQEQNIKISLVLMTHDDNGLLVGALAHIERDTYVTIVANEDAITFQVIN